VLTASETPAPFVKVISNVMVMLMETMPQTSKYISGGTHFKDHVLREIHARAISIATVMLTVPMPPYSSRTSAAAECPFHASHVRRGSGAVITELEHY
jgi:hypothetical protein